MIHGCKKYNRMSLEVVGVHPQGKVFANRSSSVNKAQYFVTCSDLITSVVHHFSLSANAEVLIMMKFGLISTISLRTRYQSTHELNSCFKLWWGNTRCSWWAPWWKNGTATCSKDCVDHLWTTATRHYDWRMLTFFFAACWLEILGDCRGRYSGLDPLI